MSLPAHCTEWMILIFAAWLFCSLCVSFRCLYLAIGTDAWLAPLSIYLCTCAAEIVLEVGFVVESEVSVYKLRIPA